MSKYFIEVHKVDPEQTAFRMRSEASIKFVKFKYIWIGTSNTYV